MKFESLSDAIRYYTTDTQELTSGASPYSILGNQLGIIPTNLIPLESQLEVMIYGKTVWGQSVIVNQDKPGI
jgi:hypothetical protein